MSDADEYDSPVRRFLGVDLSSIWGPLQLGAVFIVVSVLGRMLGRCVARTFGFVASGDLGGNLMDWWIEKVQEARRERARLEARAAKKARGEAGAQKRSGKGKASSKKLK